MNNKYVKTEISPFNIKFYGNKTPKKVGYFNNSILLTECIIDVNNNNYPRAFLEKILKICNNLMKQIVQIDDDDVVDDDDDDDDGEENYANGGKTKYGL